MSLALPAAFCIIHSIAYKTRLFRLRVAYRVVEEARCSKPA